MSRATLLLLLLLALARPAAADIVADVDDHLVGITTGFSGTRILVFGSIDGEGEVVVVVRGPSGPAKLYRKSPVLGVWVNSAALTFVQAPSFYAVASTKPLEEIANASERKRLKLGIDHLELKAIGRVSENLLKEWREALVRAMVRDRLYRVEPGEVLLLNQRLFRVDFELPAKVSTGTYLVEAYLFEDGVAVAAQTLPLVVNKIGFEAAIYSFAQQQAPLYGIAAIVVALLAGWIAHLVFRRP
ncbi:MAG TPA: TIGR02186 family protein [Kiloniellales bacterium]|nr:TIGR02186 family protein [Kiloniellales bacterium]